MARPLRRTSRSLVAVASLGCVAALLSGCVNAAREGIDDVYEHDTIGTFYDVPDPLPHGEPGSNDENHAHKASVLFWNGTLYHFYCATRPSRPGDCAEVFHEFRTICAAASRPWNETVR